MTSQSTKHRDPTGISSEQDENPIQAAVDRLLNKLLDHLGGNAPRFLAVHFACGTPGRPGYIIRSAVHASNCQMATWASAIAGPQNLTEGEVHGRAIIRHVREFHRSETLLNLLSQLSTGSPKPLVFEFRTDAKTPTLDVENNAAGSFAKVGFKLNSDIASKLSPPNLIETYLMRLYSESPQNSRGSEVRHGLKPFDLPRSEAFGMLTALFADTGFWDRVGPFESALDPVVRGWRLLGPLQSALLYFKAGRPANPKNPNEDLSGFGYACRLGPVERGAPETVIEPICMLFGTPIPEPAILNDLKALVFDELGRDPVRDHLRVAKEEGDQHELEAALLRELRDDSHPAMAPDAPGEIKRELEKAIKGLVDLDGQRARMTRAVLWMCCLATKLREAKHEGNAMDFWFVAGERTEFADDPEVRLDKTPIVVHKAENAQGQGILVDVAREFQPSVSSGKLDPTKTRLTVRRLEKEHFPWFSMGRHALFFDISDDKCKPCGLAELRVGSWQRLVTESYKLPDEQRLDVPACALVFTDGHSGESGVILCQHPKEGGKPKIERLLRFRHGVWQLASDQREQALGFLIRKCAYLDEIDTKRISQIALMVADDPHAGGTLVFVDNGQTGDKFLKLGLPWKFDREDRDRIPLISHDGATLLWKEGEDLNWAYRKMSLADRDIDRDAEGYLHALQEQSLGNDPKFPLAGVGTRRWSAALCALRPGVRLVIVISTDGDMTCWWQGKMEKDHHTSGGKEGENWLQFKYLAVGMQTVPEGEPVLKLKGVAK